MAKAKDWTDNRYTFRLSHDLMDSEAFATLDPLAVRVMLVIGRAHDGYNNGDILLSQRDAMAATGCRKPGAMVEAFAQLEVRGVLFRTYMGRRISPTKGLASRWELTDVYCRDAKGIIVPPRMDFIDWKEGMDKRLPAGTERPLSPTARKKQQPATTVLNLAAARQMNGVPMAAKRTEIEDGDIPF